MKPIKLWNRKTTVKLKLMVLNVLKKHETQQILHCTQTVGFQNYQLYRIHKIV